MFYYLPIQILGYATPASIHTAVTLATAATFQNCTGYVTAVATDIILVARRRRVGQPVAVVFTRIRTAVFFVRCLYKKLVTYTYVHRFCDHAIFYYIIFSKQLFYFLFCIIPSFFILIEVYIRPIYNLDRRLK